MFLSLKEEIIMSMFSGKCDFYDIFVEGNNEEQLKERLKQLKLYVIGKDGRNHRVKSDTIQDIAKYYPYLEVCSFSNSDGYRVITLSSDSFIDKEESEHKQWYINDVFKYQRKCKRNKQPFTANGFFKEYSWRVKSTALVEIVNRIVDKGDKAKFDDIHMSIWEDFRKRWYEELIRLGYSEYEAYNWCFKDIFNVGKRLEIVD